MNHCMMDLETFGIKPGSVLRSIGARMFDLDGSVGRSFYVNIAEEGQGSLEKDPKTVEWWNEPQRAEAQAQLLVSPVPLTTAITAFHTFYRNNNGKFLWGHGANFDPVLWEAACREVEISWPWRFQNVRCTRTWYAAHGFDPKTIKREGTHHNALDDVDYQIACVQAAARVRQVSDKPDLLPLAKDPRSGQPEVRSSSLTMLK